jgi:16S rRNA (guanine966-N2)-methyltransferase
MSLRIIGGEFRNRLLKAPKGIKTRPTLAILRKAVFDMLQFTIQEAHFLDLFAGSGLMGIEALSRGAARACFIDKDRTAIRCIEENLKVLGLQDKAEVLLLDASAALHRFAKKKSTFDVIYIDPPYPLSQTTPILQDLLQFIDTHSLLAPQGHLLIEETTPSKLSNEMPLNTLRFVNTRQFSDSLLHQYIHIS